MKFKIALDVDDVLMPCVSKACDELGIDIKKVSDWDIDLCDMTKKEKTAFMSKMAEQEFYKSQTPYAGARMFIEMLQAMGHDVCIASAVNSCAMNERAAMIKEFFPSITDKDIVLGGRKDLLSVDFLLDDNPYTLMKAKARNPVLMSREHNRNAQGLLRVSDYIEFLELIKGIEKAEDLPHVRPKVLMLVGPSGSGKSFICDELVKDPRFGKIRAVTDRAPRAGEVNGREYTFLSKEDFDKIEGNLLESTVYHKSRYGISKDSIEDITAKGQIAVKPVDISGAMEIKRRYGAEALVLFVRRSKLDMMASVIRRGGDPDEAAERIASMDAEASNEMKCDFTISNTADIKHALSQVYRLL